MDVRGGEKRMDSRSRCDLDGVPCDTDVVLEAARECGDTRAPNVPGDTLHGVEISGGSDRKAGFDDVHTELLELARKAQLFFGVHATTGRLLAIAQRSIENEQAIGRGALRHAPNLLLKR